MKRRRGRGEGAIYKRGDSGLWCSVFTMGYDQNGRRKRRYVYGCSKKDVQEKLLKLHNDFSQGFMLDATRITVKEFLEQWLEEAVRPGVRQSTFVRYDSIIRLHIFPYIGGLKLNQLSSNHIQKFYGFLRQNNRSPRTIQLVHVLLSKSFNQALRWNTITANPCALVSKPKVLKKSMKFWTAEQLSHFLEQAKKDRLYGLYVLAITSGLRLGELFGLKWTDLNIDNRTLAIQRTVHDLNGHNRVGEPKTSKGKRNIILPKFAINALDAHAQAMRSEGITSEWIFCDTIGHPLRRGNFRKRSFLGLLKESGLPPIRFHDLRHSAATLLFSQGVHPKIVQELLGHSQISITLDTYSHVLPSLQQESANKIDHVFLSPKS